MVVDDLFRGVLETLESLSPTTPTAAEAIHIFRERKKQGIKTFVAVYLGEESCVVGTASVLIERKFIHAGRRVGHIEDVVVMNTLQGLGIGKLLLEACRQFCVKQNCYKLVLNCKPSLIEYYSKSGYAGSGNAQMRMNLK